ncbi:MAG: hypothetical protein WDN28_25685 [Chthoniobacter sp.]
MWSLDWFSTERLARTGARVRRAGWTDRWLEIRSGIYYRVTASTATIVKATDFGADDLNARDWTDQPFSADPCAATPAYNSESVTYGQWTAAPIFTPPPVPGFVSL